MKHDPAADPQVNRKRPRASSALMVLVTGLIGAVLYFAHAAFVPIALSVLFALLLSGPVEALHRRRIPRGLSAFVILLLFLAGLGSAVDMLWSPAQAWLASAPRTSQIIQHKISPIARFAQRIDALSDRAGHLADRPGSTTAPPLTITAVSAPEAGSTLLQTRQMLISAITFVILTLFILAAGPPVLARMSAAFSEDVQTMHVLKMIEAVRRELGRYYATIALINLALGAATTGLMLALGMPNPVLCGALAAVLNFIPYAGSSTAFVILSVVAFVTFDDIARVLMVMGSYLGLLAIEGQIVQPLLVGRRLELNPIIVFLSLWFGGWFWGISGIVLAIPAIIALKVVAEHSRRGAAMLRFLNPGDAKPSRFAQTAKK